MNCRITISDDCELQVDMWDDKNVHARARYTKFKVWFSSFS